MSALWLVLLTIFLLPIRNADDYALRWELAEAAQAATDDLQEQALLVAIPRWEAAYRRDVFACVKRGSAGEVSGWQILARSDAERKRLCVSYAQDAVVALERIRESRAACRHLPPSEQLSIFTRGLCSSVEGRRLSRHRWVTVPAVSP